MTDTLGLYIHIPYCRSRCLYCAFYSQAARVPDAYVEALLRDMEGSRAYVSMAVDTVYLGGGTPSVLTEEQLTRLMEGVRAVFSVTDDAEITMEMNPCDMTEGYLAHARSLGLNRLSVGVEARNDRLLRTIGRRHTAIEAEQAVRRAFRAGFRNISIDLMCELPTQRVEEFERDLLWAVHLPITHLSVYSLILEEGTRLFQLAGEGRLPRPTEWESWAMYRAMCRILPHYGFGRYEISSFARRGYESRHNEKYWRLAPYIGFGPSACSRMGRRRWAVLPGTRRYMRELLSGRPAPVEESVLTEAEDMEEYCFLHLRMRSGIPRADFERRYGAPPERWYGDVLEKLKGERLLTEREGSLVMTARGAALGNTVFASFLRSGE